ncbi:MAG: hypothetical protein HYR91_09545 [Flavobacteriia bacterium]|nr:hypothetical protein [Flavobacteriia bacterium]
MLKTYSFFIFIFLFSCQIKSKNNQNTITEIAYFHARNHAIKFFSNISNEPYNDQLYQQEKDSLLTLEKKLRKCYKGSKIQNIAKKGQINLQTLLKNEPNFGKMDGLTISKDSMNIFCTPQKIFNIIYKKNPIRLDKILSSNQFEKIINHVFAIDACYTNFYFTPLASSKNQKIYASIGNASQDIGLFEPNYIYIMILSDGFIYITEKQIVKPFNKIKKCAAIWEEFNHQIYSNDSMAIENKMQIENAVWKKYCDCFQIELKNEKQFKHLKIEMHKIVSSIFI